MENETGTVDTSVNEGAQDTNPEVEVESTETTEETLEEVKERLAKAEELAKNYKVRAEKAEKGNKVVATATPAPVQSGKDLSQSDLLAILRNNVNEDDVDEVKDYAKLKNVSVAEALKSNFVKSFLKEKEENRRVANASNTGAVRRSTAKVADETLVSKALKGEMPESDEDIDRLVSARFEGKKQKK